MAIEPQDREKEEPADMARLPLSQEIKTEERNLFDDYYLSALQGVATIISSVYPKGMDEIEAATEIIPIFAREIAVQAIKNRATYLYGGYKE
ncbi:MAG: hypothetical protein LBQ89_07865 [Treponema sp.]|jgi:hypothetical protein|nr:hypothetical protein [Treponema sp.]